MLDNVIVRILKSVLPKLSGELRQAFIQLLKNLKQQAEKTDNPYDDVLVELLFALFDVNPNQ